MPEKHSVRSISRGGGHSARARRQRLALQRILPVFVLALGLVGMPSLLLSGGGIGKLERLRSERETVQLEISRLSKRIEHLQAEAAALKSDPQRVERTARDELGLLRRTEIVFHFESEDPH